MTCREFAKQTKALTPAELIRSDDQALVAHQQECARCAKWLQQERSLAGALQTLQTSAATLEAGSNVEHAVLRAFRQAAVPGVQAEADRSTAFAFSFNRFFAWPRYAAAVGAVILFVGLGTWLWYPGKTSKQSQPALARIQQSAPNTTSSANTGQIQPSSEATEPAQSATPGAALARSTREQAKQQRGYSPALTQAAQGYVPLMLCDPLSCSGDEQVVRMELPANAGDASRDASEPLVADVVLGDDGLVRAIRIVQQ